MTDWILPNLSPEQREPFTRTTGNASILAAAGSGKTRTLVHLVVSDLASGIPANGIIAFTFTEKAAEELLARIHALVMTYLPGVSLEGIYIGTIHAWCLKYLLEQPAFYGFTPIDELHMDALVSRLYDALELEQTYGKPYPRAVGDFLADIEILYNEHLDLEHAPLTIRHSLELFLDVLQGNRLMTFGGMIRHATDHLQANGSIPELHSLYVDEYQDVNPAQVELIKAMLPPSGKVVVVGDDLQCIYNWRGSDVTRILNFPREFNDVSVHRLSTNYRARPRIVHVGNTIASNVVLRDPEKVMLPGREDATVPVVHWISTSSEEDQAEAVASIVERFSADGVPYNKIAILLRSVLGSGRTFVDALTARGITIQCPILSRGGGFINEFVLPVFNWIRAEHLEPKNAQEEAEAEQAAVTLAANVSSWVSDLDMFWDNINHWIDLINEQNNDAYDVRGRFYDFMDVCGIRVEPEDSDLMVGLGIASQIIRSVEEIHRRRLEGHNRRTPRGVVSEVYHALLRRQSDFGESVPIDTDADGVLITTVHQAKGLEWPVVIIPMLMRSRFPVNNRGHGTRFPDNIAVRYGTGTEDERRLFYVAATRAKERLFLLDAARNNPRTRSIFLNELRTAGVIEVVELADVETGVWKIEAKDLVASDPPPIRIGLSDLLIYLECPYQFGLRRVAAVQPSVGDELGFGKGLHELIQRHFEADSEWSPDELENQVNEYVNLPYMSEEGEKQSRQAIKQRLIDLDQLGVFDTQVESEVSVEVILGNGVVHGIIDLIQIKGDGSLHIRDWKANVHDDFVPRYERQLQLYTYALRQQGKLVSDADLVDVAASSKAGTLVTRKIDISEASISRLIASLEDGLRNIAEGLYSAKPSEIACASCDMRRICSKRYSP